MSDLCPHEQRLRERRIEPNFPPEPTTTADSDRICITCGKTGGACRWVDDVEHCMREQLTALRTPDPISAAAAHVDTATTMPTDWAAGDCNGVSFEAVRIHGRVWFRVHSPASGNVIAFRADRDMLLSLHAWIGKVTSIDEAGAGR
jgi:hypothetical protein